jgi:uncharacterized protein with PQ loop repeat
MSCVTSGETISNILGLLSSIVWFFVLIPQLYQNYKKQDSDAVSLFLILLWLVGDYLSMLSAQVKGISKVVIYVAIYHIVIGVIFAIQIIYYRYKKYKRYFNNNYSPILDAYDENTNSIDNEEVVDYYNYLLLTNNEQIFIFSSVLSIIILNTVFYFNQSTLPSNDGFVKGYFLADIVAWLTTLIFIGSRIPQIHLNYKRKSTQGLSVYSFITLNIANYLFLTSILVNICDNIGNESVFLLSNLQWIAGSISGSVLDIILFYQFYIYS